MLKSIRALLAVFVTLSLIACGGSGGDSGGTPSSGNQTSSHSTATSITQNLTGTVAIGAPVPAIITIVDRRGNTVVTTSNSNGEYSVNLGSRPGPYLIRIEPTDSSIPVMYSFATNSGVANATPFTTLALFLTFGNVLETAFNDWASYADAWDRRDLEQTLAMINANFSDELSTIAAFDPTRYDCFTTPFSANSTYYDAFLDEFIATIDWNTGTYSIQNSSGSELLLDQTIDTSGFYIGAEFIPVASATWEFTWEQTIDGVPSINNFIVATSSVPLRKEHLFPDLWQLYETLPVGSITVCNDEPSINCDIRMTTTRFDSTYQVSGDGGIGTLVTGSFDWNWVISGWVEVVGLPRETVSDSGNVSYRWSWLRTE